MKRIYTMDTVPTKVKEWYAKAMHFKVQWDKAKAIEQKQLSYHHFAHKSSHQKSQNKPPKDPDAMDVDAVKVRKLDPTERQRCINNGLCFWCRKAGHISNRCPNFPDQKIQVQKIQSNEPKEETTKEENLDKEIVMKISAQDFWNGVPPWCKVPPSPV